MKLLIIGASGVLGSRLYNDAIKKKWNVLGTYSSHEYEGLSYLDLRDKNSIAKVFNFFKPEAVVLAGGLTDVDLCESKPGLAKEVNVDGTFNILKDIRSHNARLVYVSTDYIFDGKSGPYGEDDKPCPINVYGRTKLEAEGLVKSAMKDYLIVRTAQIYGADPLSRNFCTKIINNMRNNKKVYAAEDFYCTPTYAGQLSASIIKLLEEKKKGIFNSAGSDFINRYEYVNKISDIFGLHKELIQKVKLSDLNLKAKRPRLSGLKVDKLEQETGVSVYGCDEGLKMFKEDIEL